MEEIASNMHNLHSIFSTLNYSLYIPVFQREFVWDEEIIEQLISDFRDDSDEFSIDSSQLPGYLLGNIVLIKPSSDFSHHSVVDGQQRLITLSLLAKALDSRLLSKVSETASNQVEMRKWMSNNSDISKFFFIVNDDSERTADRIVFNEYLKYGDFYSNLINDNINNFNELELTNAEQNIYEVYLKLKELISELTDEQLRKFVNYVKKNIKLIITVAPSEEKAFQLFEVLNSRGRVLEPLDLIKNIFLQKIYEDNQTDQEKRMFNQDWNEFSDNLVIAKNRVISSSTFLKHYIIGRYGINLKKDKLYSYIKGKDLNSSEIIELAKDLKKTSSIYRDIEKKLFHSFIESTEGNISDTQKQILETKISIIFKILGVSQFHSLLIPFYFDNYERKAQVLDKALKFGAAVLFAQRQTNVIESGIESFLSEYIRDRDEENKFQTFLDKIERKTNEYINEFRNALYMVNYGNKQKKILNLLKFIEVYGNQNRDVLHAPKTGSNSITLEHIMPQAPLDEVSEYNFNDIIEYDNYKHCIGNLAMLKVSPNSGVGNDSFSNKIDDYKESSFYLTKNIIEPSVNNRTTGQQYDRTTHINRWNTPYTSLVDESGSALTINENWTKEAIVSRGKKMTEYIVYLLQ